MGPRDETERILEKVRGLLAKAEATTFPAEAEAFTAKAQELLSRHRLEDLLAEAATDTSSAQDPGRVRLQVDPPYVTGKFHLLSGIARANHCGAVLERTSGVVTIVGYPADTAAVGVLFTSLLLQGTAALLAEGGRADAAGRSRTRSFRHAFWLAYGERIGDRLARATAGAEADAGARDALPVLARRDAAVADAVATGFGPLRRLRPSVSNASGLSAGVAAADRADLSVAPHLDR